MMAALRELSGRLASTVVRGVLNLVDDATKMQMVQIGLRANETRDQIERFQQYGFTSHPKPGAEVVALGVGGNREHTVIIAVDDRRYRLKNLVEGEVGLYDDQGQSIIITRAGVEVKGLNVTIKELTPGSGKITLDANEIEVNGGASLTVNTPEVTVNATATCALLSPSVDIGALGGPPVARIGDHVDNNALIDTGSSTVRAA